MPLRLRLLPKRPSLSAAILASCLLSSLVAPGWAAPSVRIVRFNDLKPDQARITTCWDALGIDHEQRVYIAFSDQSEQHPYDTLLFRYDTRSEQRELLGTLRQISAAAGNLLEGETIAKIHVPFIEHAGKFYFSSHDYHRFEGLEDLAKRRGGHIYSYDLATGKFDDLSRTDPSGVSVAQQGIIGLTVVPQQNLLVGLTYPFGDLLTYNLETGLTRFHQGVDAHRPGRRPTRHIWTSRKGRVFFSYYDEKPSPIYAFDPQTGEIEKRPERLHIGMTYGAHTTRDGSKIFLVDSWGYLYVFHSDEERLEELGTLLPPEQVAAGLEVTTSFALVLSHDEKTLYTFPSRLTEAPALRMYAMDLETGRKWQVADFTTELNGSSPGSREDRHGRVTGGVMDDQGRMYFGYHESGDDGRNGVMLQVTLE